MTNSAEPQLSRELWVGAMLSVAVHVAIVAAIVVVTAADEQADIDEQEEESVEIELDDDWEEAAPEEPAVAVAPEPEDPLQDDPLDEDEPHREEPDEEEQEEEQEDLPEEEEQEDTDEQPDEVPDDLPQEKIAVDQVTDDEEPEEADHISDEAHRTDEEQVAETTTLEDIEPHRDPEATEQDIDADRELAMEMPDEPFEEPDVVDPDALEPDDEPPEEVEDVPEEEDDEDLEDDDPDEDAPPEEIVGDQPEQKYRDPQEMFAERPEEPTETGERSQLEPRELFERDWQRAKEAFEESSASETSGSRTPSGRRLLANWRENEQAMRASLENFIPHVEPGNHTSVNASAAEHASYIARMHRTIHANWGHGFLPRLERNFPSSHPLNDESLMTRVEIVIDADTGEVLETVRIQPSGNELFDAEALNIARNVGDQPDPPDSIVSPDGRVYIHWTFWRDNRQCGTFGVRIYRLDEGESRPLGDE